MKDKLQPKKMSIQEIATSIRQNGDALKTVENNVTVNELIENEDSTHLVLDGYLSRIQEKQYSCTGVLYVDEEIKEVFAMLKSKAKIPISSLVSMILEDWLIKNKEDIASLINSKNRFL